MNNLSDKYRLTNYRHFYSRKEAKDLLQLPWYLDTQVACQAIDNLSLIISVNPVIKVLITTLKQSYSHLSRKTFYGKATLTVLLFFCVMYFHFFSNRGNG